MKFDGIMLEKVNRLTAWVSFIIVGVYIATGFGSVGMWGMRDLLGKARSDYWHNNHYLAYLLIIALAVHAAICLYRTLKKHRII